jgi:hypothetical protein
MIAPTTSTQLILNSLRAFTQGQTLSEWSLVDWDEVLSGAAHQRLIPILQATLDKSVLPADIRQKLEHAARQQRIRTALLVDAFATVNTAFMQAAIPVMPIKGMFLAHQVYGSVNHRYFDDIDLLVPTEAAREAVALMHQLGYIVHPRAEKPDWHHLAPFLHPQSQVVIEIHTDLIRRASPGWEVAEIWGRAKRGRIAGVETYLIDEADALIHTALHARHTLYKRISFFLDAYLQLRQLQVHKQVDAFPEMAQSAGARVALTYLLAVGEQLFGNDAAAMLTAPRWRVGLTRRLAGWDTLTQRQSTLTEGPLPNLLELLLMDSWSHSLRMAYRLIFPPPQFLAEFYGADQKLNYGKRLLTRTRRVTQQVFNRR